MKYNDWYNARILFTIDRCEHCRVYKSFIERYNLKVSLDKQIMIVDCTKYFEFGIIEHPLILKYSKNLKGNFPVLFFKGGRVDGAEARFIMEQFIKTILQEDFKIEEENKYLYTKQCQVVKKGVFRSPTLVCG